MPDLTTPFIPVFDYPFQNVLPPDAVIAVDPCRTPGYLLHWLTLRGWCSYLFQGNTDTDFDVQSKGTYISNDVKVDALRTGGDQLLLRAGSLTQSQVQVLKSIYLSPAIYALMPGPGDKYQLVRVYIEAGTFAIWRDATSRMNLEVKIVLPTINSQRT